MEPITKYEPGEFCWTDLGTTDVPGAKKFYQGLFGWTVKEIPMGDQGSYSIFQIDGRDVCAVHPMMPNREGQLKIEIPPNWLAFVTVASADDSVAKAKAAGAQVLMPPSDAMEAGRMAILKDPTGAVIALWQPRKHVGAGIAGVPGTVCWRELYTPNVDISAKVYSTLFGWTGSATEMGNVTYHQFSKGEERVAGMLLPPMKGIHPHWLTYWLVESCDSTIARSKQLNGQVVHPTTAIPGMGRFAILSDPQGAVFGIFEGAGE